VNSRPLLAFLLAVAITAGCRGPRDVDPHLDRSYPDRLSGWQLFTAANGILQPAARVLPYELNTTLFSDYADKSRTVWMPAGQAASYRGDEVFRFPVGTILTKTFSFMQKDGKSRLIETRLIIRQPSGWVALEYVWNREQTDADLDVSPLPVAVRRKDAAGIEQAIDYHMPNVNQCSACHDGGSEGAIPLGPAARNLNRGDQLARWVQAGYLTGLPAGGDVPRAPVWDDPITGTVSQRARAYLDVNCASCHRPGRKAAKNGLVLRAQDPDPDRRGIESIIARMETLDPEKKMPVLGHDVVHREAAGLMRDWAAGAKP
jgi:uncharacterized repeat protein (TIGR03806 family)